MSTALSPSRQVIFHQMLVAARKSVLMDALSEALGQLDPNVTKKQILAYGPADALKILAAAGIRDEHVFPATFPNCHSSRLALSSTAVTITPSAGRRRSMSFSRSSRS